MSMAADHKTLTAKLAWMMAKDQDQNSITSLAERIAEPMDEDWGALRDSIVESLFELSAERYICDDGTKFGRVDEISSDQSCWWIETNAYTDWFADEPEWWSEAIADAKAEQEANER